VRATLSITDENGNTYEGNIELSLVGDSPALAEGTHNSIFVATGGPIDFSLPVRAFARTYAASNSSGAARLVVLLAYIAKGIDTADVSADTIRAEWGKLTSHLGAFNRAHFTRAKDRAWVDSPGPGTYHLGPRWREAFGSL
jgi:hypothetical protein